MVGLFPVFIISLLFILLGLGHWIGRKYEHPWLGMAIGIGIFMLTALCYIGVILLHLWWQPNLPICHLGKCKKYKDYELIKLTDGSWVYRCCCGTYYILKEAEGKGRLFMVYLEDGNTKPYLKHTRFGRWKSDNRRVVEGELS